MHRFRITERPCAQLQDGGAPEGYRRREPSEKKGSITMEGSQRKTRDWRGAAVFRKRDGGKRLSRQSGEIRKSLEDHRMVKIGNRLSRHGGEMGGGAAPPNPPREGAAPPLDPPLYFRTCAATVYPGFIQRRIRTRVFGCDSSIHRFRIMERPSAQLQDGGAPEGYRRKEAFDKKGAIAMEGSPRGRREEAFKTRRGNPEESVLRRPQGGQNREQEAFKTRGRNGRGAARPKPPLRGRLRPPSTPRFIFGRAPLRSTPVSFKGGIVGHFTLTHCIIP